MAECDSMNPDPIEAILRNRVPLANVTHKGSSILSSPAYHSENRGFPSPTSSTSSSDALLLSQSSKARAKTAKQEELLGKGGEGGGAGGGGRSAGNNNSIDATASRTTNEIIKVEPALESCLGETGTGLAWLQHVLRTKSSAADSCVIGKETMTDGTSKQRSPTIRTELSQDGKDILRQLLNSVAIDDEILNRYSGSTPSWSFLTRSDGPGLFPGHANNTPIKHPSLFVLILQQVFTNCDTKGDITNHEHHIPATKATQILKACSPYFENKCVSKNIPAEANSNQVIFAALSFLSATTIPYLDLEEDWVQQDERITSVADPHHHFPLMPLLIPPPSDNHDDHNNNANEEEHNPNLRMYQINEPNLTPSSLHDTHFLTKIHNLEASFWASTVQYSSRLRVIPRMEDTSHERMLLFMGGSTKKGDLEASSSSKKSVKKVSGSGSGAAKRKVAEGQTLGSDGKSRKKKASVDNAPKV